MFSYQDLIEFLNNPAKSYMQGLMIYNVYKHTNKYDQYFGQVQDPALEDSHFIILLEQLNYIQQKIQSNSNFVPNVQNISKELPEIELSPVVPKKNVVRIAEDTRIDIDTLPPELFAEYQKNKENWNKIKALHAELRVLSEDSSNNDRRKSILNEINIIEQESRSIWMKIEKWNITRSEPEIKEPDNIDKQITKLRRKIKLTKEYLKKKNLRKATFDKYTSQLEVTQTELDEILRTKASRKPV